MKIDDKGLVKEHGVFALPAILFFKGGSKEPVIYAGDLYDEQAILQWLLIQKDPSGDVIELFEGSELMGLIEKEEALAIYFCKYYIMFIKIYCTYKCLSLLAFFRCIRVSRSFTYNDI